MNECEPVCCTLTSVPGATSGFSVIAPSLCLFVFLFLRGPECFGCWCGDFCCESSVFDNVSNHGAPLALACVIDKSENAIQVGVFFPALLNMLCSFCVAIWFQVSGWGLLDSFLLRLSLPH